MAATIYIYSLAWYGNLSSLRISYRLGVCVMYITSDDHRGVTIFGHINCGLLELK